jgi:hypothetical protein
MLKHIKRRLRTSKNRMLRRVTGPDKEEVIWGYRELPNKELHNFYSSPNIIQVIKLKIKRWEGHVERMQFIFIS